MSAKNKNFRYFINFTFALLSTFCFALAHAEEKDSGDKALAKFDGSKLTVAEFARRQPALLSWAGLGANSDQMELAVEDIVFESVLAKEAKASGVADKPEVQDQINKLLKGAYLKDKLSLDDIEVADSEVEMYYSKNREKYKKPDILKYSHILLPSHAAAEKVRQELATGSWDKIATQSLDSVTAKRGGSFGAVPPTMFTEDLRNAAKTVEPGAVSDLVKTVFGFHILKLDKTPETNYLALEDVRKEIYEELLRQKRKERLGSVQKKLWDKYDVEIDQAAIADLVKQYSEQNVNVDRSTIVNPREIQSKKTDLQLITELIDLGKIESKEISETVLVANNSDHAVEILKVGSNCPCMKATIADKNLKPGQVTKLSFTYDPNVLKDGGNVERMVLMESNDKIDPRKYIRVRATVKRSSSAK